MKDWNLEDCKNWLINDLNFPQYTNLFEKNHITGKFLINLSIHMLKDIGIGSVGHRMEIFEKIQKQKKINFILFFFNLLFFFLLCIFFFF